MKKCALYLLCTLFAISLQAKPRISSSSPELQRIFDDPVLLDGVWTITIPDGKYSLEANADGCAIEIHGQENIAIYGSGNVEIIGSDPTKDFIRISRSKNILLKGFCVDLSPLPFLQGDILNVDFNKSTITVKIGEEFVRPDDIRFEKFKGNVSIFPKGEALSYIANPQRPRYESAENLGGGVWGIKLDRIEDRYVGGKLLMYAWFNGWLSSISGSSGITLENIRTYCVTGGNYYIVHNDGDVTVKGCTIRPREGSGHLWAADGGNQGGYNAGTVTFENNDFVHINDDGINMGTNYVTVAEKLSDREIKIDCDHAESFKQGDVVEIWDWRTKEPTAQCEVVSTRKDEDARLVLKLSQKVGEIVPGFHDDDRERQRKNPYTRVINVTRSGKIVMRGNKITSFRARGALVKCQNSIIENNTFYNMGMESLLVGPEFYWEEGPGVSNLVIRGNTFLKVRTTAVGIASRNAESAAINNSKILIENNKFFYSNDTFSLEHPKREYEGNAIFVDNSESVKIRKNIFVGFPAKDKVIIIGPATKNILSEDNIFQNE